MSTLIFNINYTQVEYLTRDYILFWEENKNEEI